MTAADIRTMLDRACMMVDLRTFGWKQHYPYYSAGHRHKHERHAHLTKLEERPPTFSPPQHPALGQQGGYGVPHWVVMSQHGVIYCIGSGQLDDCLVEVNRC